MKVVMLIFMSIVLFVSQGYTYTDTLTPVEKDVIVNGNIKELTYTSTRSVIQGADLFVKLKVPYSFGYILKTAVKFGSSSPNVDIMASTVDGETAETINTIFYITDYNLVESPYLPCDAYFNAGQYCVFLRVSNQSATPTGNWNLIFVIDNRR